MKGQKAYQLATTVFKEMQSRSHDEEEQNLLYFRYLGLIKKAAYKGHTEAIYDLGQQYEDVGYLGIPNPMYNARKCVYWYKKACEGNHPEACNNLATFYESGNGCDKDLNKALALYKRSADLGYSIGKKNYKIMTKDMSKGGKYYSASAISPEKNPK